MAETSASAPFGRVLTAMVTPFSADGALDPDTAQGLAHHLVEHGHDGLVILGTTGESPTVGDDEAATLWRAVVEAVAGQAVVVAGVGTNDTRHSVELARQAEKCGADGLLVVTPYYSKPPQEGVAQHFVTVADATDLPVMLYDIPGRTGTRIAAETFARVAGHERIVAVKDAVGDLGAGSWVMQRTGLAYYSGDDVLNLGWLTHGAAGVVSVVGHVAGDDYAAMVAAIDSGDLPAARQIYRRLLPAVEAIMTRTQGAIMVKAALELQGVLPNRAVRPPLVEATEGQIDQLRPDLLAAGLLQDTGA
ncbi:MAG TPA: 4-hydroxy-tetrahydrodipicolinate synthase [Nocardioidaceae bacterium]|jgi:4-hydroxy-tetrahydrodipicolinate synthase|nr:4-hydroxy-tetrahydrodipicolinate synthase [Actinomycetota bacterium]MDQ3424294.1 4-hydroxy-tetrahydrodipicolinate synthase [Actinomycetota bacterium]HEV8055375.1 4-hydroxy-tetrahydrodipicolinate synthase [Nocardioidaceae bacterium]